MKQYTLVIRRSFFIIFLLALAGVSAKVAFALDLPVDVNSTSNTAAVLSGDVSPSSLPTLKTSIGLSVAVDQIIKKVDGTNDADFCTALDDTILGLDNGARETLAWKTSSYESNTKLDVKAGASEDVKAKYQSLQSGYADLNTKIDALTDMNSGASLRAATTLRSVYLELLNEYRGGNPNADRVASLKAAIDKMTACVSKSDSATLSSATSVALGGSATVEAPLTVTQADVKNDTKADIKAESVSSKADLSAYVKGVLSKNADVSEVETDSTHTQVVVRQSGKLFAFIPVHIKATATVMGGGKASVKYSWYKFLTRVPAKVTSEMVLEKLPKEVSASAKLSAKAQAQSVEAMSAVFASAK